MRAHRILDPIDSSMPPPSTTPQAIDGGREDEGGHLGHPLCGFQRRPEGLPALFIIGLAIADEAGSNDRAVLWEAREVLLRDALAGYRVKGFHWSLDALLGALLTRAEGLEVFASLAELTGLARALPIAPIGPVDAVVSLRSSHKG